MAVPKNQHPFNQPLLLQKRCANATISAETSQESSTSALYAECKGAPFDFDLPQYKTNELNQFETDTNAIARGTVDLQLHICCPMHLIFYLFTVCFAPRCCNMFTMIISTLWILMDEITDIIFIVLIYTCFDYCIVALYPYPYIIIGCISLNHFCNVILSVIIRNNWCICDPFLHKKIPQCMQWFFLLSVGIFNCATFNNICKTYYLSENKNNVVTIYMEQQSFCSRINIEVMNKKYDMEAVSTKEMFSTMLEKEAQIYPLLIIIQLCKTIPKLIVFAEIASIACVDTLHSYTLAKLVMAIISLVYEIKSCYISCANAEFIEQYGDH